MILVLSHDEWITWRNKGLLVYFVASGLGSVSGQRWKCLPGNVQMVLIDL